MRKYVVGICDPEPKLLKGLMDYINSEPDRRLKAVSFTSMGALRDYLTVADIDILLTYDVSDVTTEEGVSTYEGIRTLPITDDRDADGIYKYQSVREIYRRIEEQLPQHSPKDIRRTVCVCSPVGRSGKTRLAKALARFDEVRGGLYVSMEDFGGDSDNSILYKLKTASPELRDEIVGHVVSEADIKCLYVSGTLFDIRSVLRSDLQRLTEEIFSTGSFTTVVYDLGFAAMSGPELLTYFDEVYVPVLTDAVSEAKLRSLESMLRSGGYREVLSKIIYVEVPDTEPGSSEFIREIWRQTSGG